ncbi:hypothetical protein 278BB001_38 [Bacillus phage 278BB001]|nr:hypothetical protein 278BB001_38 [Bacillus phage 278BB001]
MALSRYKQIDLLVALLDCDSNELNALEGCIIPMTDIVERAREVAAENYEYVTLGTIVWAMFDLALVEVTERMDVLVETYRSVLEGDKADLSLDWIEKAIETIAVRKNLDLWADTESDGERIYFTNNADIYKAYFEDALDHFEALTGFQIEDAE